MIDFISTIVYIKTMSNKILLVDDDLYIRELYDEILKSEGFEVETAADGKTGLEMILSNSYDLILLDIMLPKLDGIGIISNLKESKSSVSLKSIVFLTNLAHDPVVKEALSSGVHSCVVKSDITPDQLIKHVKKVLGVVEEKTTTETAKKPSQSEAQPASPEEKSTEETEKKTE
jgi:DNA-binding response OmpR family regulator